MLRLHFTAEDLGRLRFQATPAPMLELVLGLMCLRGDGVDIFDHWRVTTARSFPRQARPLLDLVYPDSGPEYLDSLAPTPDEAVAEILASDPGLVQLPYADLAAHRPVRPWVRLLAEGDRDARQTLTTALAAAQQSMLAADWQRVETSHRLDIAYRHSLMAAGGMEAVLSSILPTAIWHDNTLRMPLRFDWEIQLHGEGVLLVPSAFLTRPGFGRYVPGRPMLVMYPARIQLPMIAHSDAGPPSLGALLGSTRAAVLGAVVDRESITTSGLGRRLGISPGRASEHATVLRAAGLISSQRDGSAVLHTPTALGRELFQSGNAE